MPARDAGPAAFEDGWARVGALQAAIPETLHLRELRAWGWDEFRAIEAELSTEAMALGGSVPEVIDRLDNDALTSRDAFGTWLQELLEDAIERLDGTHFDIPEPLRRIESRVTVSAGTSYTGPSQDLTRPGRVWWFLPQDQKTFPTWRLQHRIPRRRPRASPPDRRRSVRGGLGKGLHLLGGLAGCQEGWALYAERLMDELGFHEQPGARLGYLLSQLLRAARVVLDIGLHLRLPMPSGAGMWTPGAALELLRDRCHQGPYAEPELARCLGRPGQALTYKVGERVWLAARASFPGDRRAFHGRAMEVGSLGLDQLGRELRDHPPDLAGIVGQPNLERR